MHITRIFGSLALMLALVTACELDGEVSSSGYWIHLDDAGGLAASDRVYVSGVRIGRVRQVLLDDGKAKVVFTIDGDAGVTLHTDACAKVGWYSLERHLTLELGSSASGDLAQDAEITCVKETMADKRIEEIQDRALKVLETALSGEGLIAKLLTDDAFAAKVEAFFSQQPAPAGPDAATPQETPPMEKTPDEKAREEPAEEPKAPEPRKTPKPPTSNPFSYK